MQFLGKIPGVNGSIPPLMWKWLSWDVSERLRFLACFQVEDIVIVEDLAKWQELVNERDALKWKLEHAKVSFLKCGLYPYWKV